MGAFVPFFKLRWNTTTVSPTASSTPPSSTPDKAAQQQEPNQDKEEDRKEGKESEPKSPPRPHNHGSGSAWRHVRAFSQRVGHPRTICVVSNPGHGCDQQKHQHQPKYSSIAHSNPPIRSRRILAGTREEIVKSV